MRLYLINPCNALVSITKVKENHWNSYRVWKPLSLLVLAGLFIATIALAPTSRRVRTVRARKRFPLVIAPFNVVMHLYDRAEVEAADRRLEAEREQLAALRAAAP